MVRFAYETGVKCLYSNLPGNLSLVTNYREKGENYGYTMVIVLSHVFSPLSSTGSQSDISYFLIHF